MLYALKNSEKVIVLEHNSDSLDWKQNKYFSINELEEIINLAIARSEKSFNVRYEYIRGNIDSKRNVLFVLDTVKNTPSVESTDINRINKIKVLIGYDVKGWAYGNYKAKFIQKYISSDLIAVQLFELGKTFNHNDFDFVLVFDVDSVKFLMDTPDSKIIVGISCPALLEKSERVN